MSVLPEIQPSRRQVCCLPLSLIHIKTQSSRRFDRQALLRLASSIRQHGLLEPITVRPVGPGYETVLGERRVRACLMLGYTHIDAFILSVPPGDAALLSLTENTLREPLDFFQEAEAFAALKKQGFSEEAIARRLCMEEDQVTDAARLLSLFPEARRAVLEEGLSLAHARALLALPDEESQYALARQAARLRLSVRETQAQVNKALQKLSCPPPPRRVISTVSEPRVYLNAIRGLVLEMKERGINASVETEQKKDCQEMIIRVQTRSRNL